VVSRTLLALARLGVKVQGRPGMYLSDARFAYGERDWLMLWGQMAVAARSGKVLVRDEELGLSLADVVEKSGRLVGLDGRRLGSGIVALLCAVSVVVVDVGPREPMRKRIEFKKPGGANADAWTKAAAVRRGATVS
jgi:hypothetical protein